MYVKYACKKCTNIPQYVKLLILYYIFFTALNLHEEMIIPRYT